MKKLLTTITLSLFLSLLTFYPVKADSYDFYVDQDNETGVEDGTEANPYNTIEEALDVAELNDKDNRKIYIANGEYEEKLILEEGVELYGEDKSNTIINGKNNKHTVKMKDDTKVKDLKIKKGEKAILVDDDAKVTIEDCKIKDASQAGVYIEKAKGRSDKYQVTIEDSKIYDNEGKGIYVKRKRKIEIVDNEIYDNDEEGLDIRSNVKGKVKNNEIHDNDEAGIEFIVGKADLKFTSNEIEDNKASGINAQYYEKDKKKDADALGEISLKRNDVKDNSQYGIECGIPQGGKPATTYWQQSFTLITNTILGNLLGISDPYCRL